MSQNGFGVEKFNIMKKLSLITHNIVGFKKLINIYKDLKLRLRI